MGPRRSAIRRRATSACCTATLGAQRRPHAEARQELLGLTPPCSRRDVDRFPRPPQPGVLMSLRGRARRCVTSECWPGPADEAQPHLEAAKTLDDVIQSASVLAALMTLAFLRLRSSPRQAAGKYSPRSPVDTSSIRATPQHGRVPAGLRELASRRPLRDRVPLPRSGGHGVPRPRSRPRPFEVTDPNRGTAAVTPRRLPQRPLVRCQWGTHRHGVVRRGAHRRQRDGTDHAQRRVSARSEQRSKKRSLHPRVGR